MDTQWFTPPPVSVLTQAVTTLQNS